VTRALPGLLMLALLGCASPAPDPEDADVLYLPTPPAVVDAMLRLADVHPGDVLFDLGAGDGRIVIAAAREFGVRAVGIELDGRKAAEARENVARAGLAGRVEIRQGDALDADLSEATVVTIFLFPEINARLMPKLRAELRPGSRIVSHRFGLGDWPPERRTEAHGHPLLLWTVPPR
jgi:cyclopropane fatty-acyl-phospholipid synthase-like methyltransferase